MTTPAIMAYVPGAVVTAMNSNSILPDWSNNRFYSLNDGNASTSGISQFTGYPSGDVTLQKTLPNLSPATYINSFAGAAACLTPGGYIVFIGSTSSNSVRLTAVRAFDLQVVDSFGIPGSDTAPSGAGRVLCPNSIVPLRSGLGEWVVTTAAAFNPGEVCIFSLPGMKLTNLGTTAEPAGVAGRGLVGNVGGSVFVLGRPVAADFPSSDPLGLYVVTVAELALTSLGVISPSDVDATWSHFSAAAGVAFDQTDNNPIIMVATNDAVTNTVYFVKLSAIDASVIWTCHVNALDAYADANLTKHNIVNQKLYYLGSGGVFYTINTADGTSTSVVVSTLVAPSGQISEDVNNSLTVNVDWADGGTTPVYLGTYMGDEGHHTLSSQWGRWLPAGFTAPLPQPPPPDPPIDGAAVVSINRAFSYVLDGHTFYVLDLGAQGTFVYDFVTGQWSNFATGTLATETDAANPQWNFANGTMWGQRIVGGDLLTTDLWEMVPSAVLDDDAVNIGHAVTGGLSTRSRTYLAVSAVRISASFGLIDEVSGTTFNLRFSDDQGNTWSPYYSVTLTEGSYDSEVAWRSLGSFAAPGRVFELTDSGGLVRIDGCDAFIDDFDEDTKAEPANG